MNSIKEISPSFEKVASVTDSKEFIQSFCQKALNLLEEFKEEYSKGIRGKEVDKLDAATHKIASTMGWLDLDEFVSFTRSYRSATLSDKHKNEVLLDEVLQYSHMIENSLRSKLNEL